MGIGVTVRGCFGHTALRLATTMALLAAAPVLFPKDDRAAAAGQAISRIFIDGNDGAFISSGRPVTLDSVDVSAYVSGFLFHGTATGHEFWVWFAAPDGQALAVGLYANAGSIGTKSADQPGIMVFGDGRGCGQASGQFVADDVDIANDGTLSAFSARFEFHCGGGGPADFGAVSYRSAAAFRSLAYSATSLDLGSRGIGEMTAGDFAVTNLGPDPTTVSAVSVIGADHAQFAASAGGCIDMPAGSMCTIHVEFAPTGPAGPREAFVAFHDENAPASGSPRQFHLTATVAAATGEFTPLTPSRLLDTRSGIGGYHSPVGPGMSIRLQVAGFGGVPATGVSAVVVNTTAIGPTQDSFVAVRPAGLKRPLASNLNVRRGETRANLVFVAVGPNGDIDLFNNAGSVDLVVDVAGFFADVSGPNGARFHALSPQRLFDTRFGSPDVPAAPLGAGSILSVPTSGRGGIPISGADALLLNVTVTAPSVSGYLTVFPGDGGVPLASSVNFVAGETVPNLVVVRAPSDGVIDFYNSGGATHVVADVVGYFDLNRVGAAGAFVGLPPVRVTDTRSLGGPVGPDSSFYVQFSGFPIGVPVASVAVVMNLTATAPTSAGFLTAFPNASCTAPLASNVNFDIGDTVANLAVAPLSHSSGCGFGPGGVNIYNFAGDTHVVVDLFGYFTGP